MVFSSKLTEEEKFLQKQYKTLRELKKELKKLTLKRKQEDAVANEGGPGSAKQKKAIIQGNKTPATKTHDFSSGGPNYNAKLVTSADAAANTEAAKRLLKSGAIQLKVETKTTFKRSSNLKRRLTDSEPRRKPIFQPVTTESESAEEETRGTGKLAEPNDSTATTPSSTDSRTSSFKSQESKVSRKRGRITKNLPKRGNTVYVYGFVLTEKLVEDQFTKFGNIVDVKIEKAKSCGFVTYDSFEAAEAAIRDMDDVLVENCRLKVSLARKQPMLRSVIPITDWAGLVSRDDKGHSVKDNRSLVKYDDDDVAGFDS